MSARILPAWRSLLFCPATSERFVAKAHTRGADVVILDLEDSIAPGEKDSARAAVAEASLRVGQAGADVCVRINRPLELAIPDIAAAVSTAVTVLMLPKVMGPEHLRLLSEVVTARETALDLPIGHTRFVALVETVDALPRLPDIARADPRMVALGIGGEDLATELDAVPSPDSLFVPKMLGVQAARAAGILPLGSLGSVADLSDMELYRATLRRSRALGFACATCIHPSHVAVINDTYSPSTAEIEQARRLVAAFEAALGRGQGAVAFEGRMIDAPVVDRARRLLARATA